MRMGLKQLSEPFRTTHFPIAVACLPDTVGADGDDMPSLIPSLFMDWYRYPGSNPRAIPGPMRSSHVLLTGA